MIQLNKEALTCSSEVASLIQQFEQTHTVRLPQLLHPELMRLISKGTDAGPWLPCEHDKIGRELWLKNRAALAVLNVAVHTPEFIRLVERITLCGTICGFEGRVYRMVP